MKLTTILVPTDLSPLSLQALKTATQMAPKFEARIFLLHIVEPVTVAVPAATYIYAPYLLQDDMVKEGQAELARIVADYPGVEIETAVRVGHPATEIIRAADEIHADVITIATHGRRGIARFFLGSTAEEVIRESNCPVLSVRIDPSVLQPDVEATTPAAAPKS